MEKKPRAEVWITFLELQVFGSEENFRGSGKSRRTGLPWEVAPEHKKERPTT